jgi:hypothetical protein
MPIRSVFTARYWRYISPPMPVYPRQPQGKSLSPVPRVMLVVIYPTPLLSLIHNSVTQTVLPRPARPLFPGAVCFPFRTSLMNCAN